MIADEFGVQSPIKAKPTGCCGDTLNWCFKSDLSDVLWKVYVEYY